MRPVPVGFEPVAPMRGARGVEPRLRVSVQRADYEESPTPLRGRAVRRSRRGRLKSRLKWLAAATVLAAGPTAAMTWLMVSPRFAVRELAIVTGERVPEVWVRDALAPVVGSNLPRLPLARADEILRSHPWVRGADLRKDLPARLAVRVAERQAVALLRADEGLFHVDARGARIAAFDPAAERGVDLPLISIAGDSDVSPRAESADLRAAVQLLSEIDEVEPSWAAGLSEIEVLGEEDFCVHSLDLPFPLLVRIGTLHQRVRRLEELLPQIVERFGAVAAVDLRFARRIIVKPSVERPGGPLPRRNI